MTDQNPEHKQKGMIELRLYINLARYGPTQNSFFSVEIDAEETPENLIDRLKIPLEEVGIVVINEQLVKDYHTPLKPGDRVKMFGLVGGG